MARLILTFGNKVLSNHLVHPGSGITIGRDPGNDVVIEHPSVSARHARVRQTDDGLFIADLGSTNGTFVNEDKIVDCQLAHQDWINMGKHIMIVDLYETLSLEATVQMLMAGSSVPADAEGTIMLDMGNGGDSQRIRLDYLNFLSTDRPDLELTNKQVTIGKNKDADIVIKGFWSLFAGQPSATISKRSGSYMLDYVSGVLKPKINGMAVTQPIRLNNHDIVSVGPLKMQLYLTQ
jgi:pSer/pThr/pTyr-binding forkhead associated (FHA) protein